MTKFEVIRKMVERIRTADEMSEAMRMAVIDITVVEDARAMTPKEPKEEEPKPEEPEEPKEEPKEEEPAKEPKPKKTKKERKSSVDSGKIGALRKAGWPIAKIADEMQITDQTVRNHLKKLGIA